MQTLHAYVSSIEPDKFWCRVYSYNGEPELEVFGFEFSKSALAPEELARLEMGAFLTIRLEGDDQLADIKFGREVWAGEDLARIRAQAKRLADILADDFTLEDIPQRLRDIHKQSFNNHDVIVEAERCGCFYCLRTYPPSEIEEWVFVKPGHHKRPPENTALCPKCGIDSVIGDNMGFPLTEELLLEMQQNFFRYSKGPLGRHHGDLAEGSGSDPAVTGTTEGGDA